MNFFKSFMVKFITLAMLLQNFSISVSAKIIYENDMSLLDENNVSYENLIIKDFCDEYDGKKLLGIKDINNGFGKCIYKISNASKVILEFYHTLGTVAYKTNGEYTIGISNDSYYNGKGICRIKYLTDNQSEGLYIKSKKQWYRCKYNDDNYKFYKAEDMEKILNKENNSLIDYGVNVYVSSDGNKFKRLNSKILLIKKIEYQNTDEEVPEFGTNRYFEKISVTIPKNSKYIKIEVNNIKSLDGYDDVSDNDIWNDMIYLSSVRFEIDNEKFIEEESNSEIKDVEELQQTVKSEKTKNMIIGLSDDFDIQENTKKFRYKRYSPFRKRNKIIYVNDDEDKVEKIPNKSIKKRRVNQENKTKKMKVNNDSEYLEDSYSEESQEVCAEKCKKLRLRKKWQGNNSYKNIYAKVDDNVNNKNLLLNDDKNNDKIDVMESEDNLNEEVVREFENKKDDNIETHEKEQDKEKIIGTTYLSLLIVALGSVLAGDKIGFIKKFFHF